MKNKTFLPSIDLEIPFQTIDRLHQKRRIERMKDEGPFRR